MKIVLKKNQKLFFSSDTHYHHANICSSTTTWDNAENFTRKFKSLNHMNDTLVNNFNELIGEDDILIHLGDWSFGGFEKIEEFRNRINCKNIHLTYGNHDHHIRKNKDDVQNIFSSTHDYLFLDVRSPSILGKGVMDKNSFVCIHYPIASWDGMGNGVIHLHGHVHLPPNLRLSDGKSLDVGVDGNNLFPIEYREIINIMRKQPIKKLTLPKDHHEKLF